MVFLERIKGEKSRLEREIVRVEQMLQGMPEGELQFQKNGTGHKWIHRTWSKEGRAVKNYLSKKDKDAARVLARKTYCQAYINDCRDMLFVLDKALSLWKKESRVDRIKENPAYAGLLFHGSIEQELSAWKKEPYERNEQHPEHLNVRAVNDTYVRSKSEAYILSALEAKGVAYRYECKLTLGRTTLYPDFTIRRPKSGETLIWEHFGMMSDAAYAKNAQEKVRKYMQHGYYPMRNLITTFEDDAHPLDFSFVMDIVEGL